MQISDASVENSWSEISSSSSEFVDTLVEKFHEKQPIIADFLTEAMFGLSPEAGDLGFFAALIVWRSCDLETGAVHPVSLDTMTEKYHAALAWVKSFGREGEESVLLEKKIRDFQSYPQPYLMRYALDAVLDCHEDGLDIAPEEQERLLVCLKAVVDALG
jgi:hypothetical protein